VKEGAADERAIRTLEEFLAFTEQAARLVQRGRTAYDEDEMLRLAGEAIVHRIGEAVGRLDEGFTKAHPEVSWRPMRGMRNIVAHDYGAIDAAILWNSLAVDLPREAGRVRAILAA